MIAAPAGFVTKVTTGFGPGRSAKAASTASASPSDPNPTSRPTRLRLAPTDSVSVGMLTSVPVRPAPSGGRRAAAGNARGLEITPERAGRSAAVTSPRTTGRFEVTAARGGSPRVDRVCARGS